MESDPVKMNLCSSLCIYVPCHEMFWRFNLNLYWKLPWFDADSSTHTFTALAALTTPTITRSFLTTESCVRYRVTTTMMINTTNRKNMRSQSPPCETHIQNHILRLFSGWCAWS